MKLKDVALIKAIHDFFQIYLPKQKCYSGNTVASYKYAFNLFLDYMSESKSISLFELSINDVNKDNINGFLEWLTVKRQNSSSTCNQRLMALRSFAKYLGLNDFSLSSVYAGVCAVPAKKKNSKIVEFLSEPALIELLNQPDTRKSKELRNQFFMILMYDTAARCQELLDIRIKDLSISSGAPFVYLTGRGNKIRTVPLMDTTVRHLLNYLSIFHPEYQKYGDKYLFYVVTHGVSHRMSTDTVETFMKKYGKSALQNCPDVPKQVHPHQLRHYGECFKMGSDCS